MTDRLTPETARRLKTLVEVLLMSQARYDRALYRETTPSEERDDAQDGFQEALGTLYTAVDALIDREPPR